MRALRVLFVANDGFSAGHVARSVAVARAVARRAAARDASVRIVLATTSEASALLDDPSFAVVRLPAPAAARRAGFGDAERRGLVRGAIRGACDAFGPDLVVADTFPSGPHGELVALPNARRALLRRAVSGADDVLAAGLDAYDLAIVADDPTPLAVDMPVAVVRVPPITLGEASDLLDRAAARRALALPPDGRVLLVASGGGGDADAVRDAERLAGTIRRLAPDALVVRAAGPLESKTEGEVLRVAPLFPLMLAFDGAFAPAGYNTAHELAKAGVPAALFARPRPYDDQASRARRFADAGLARALDALDDGAVGAALEWMQDARIERLQPGGADRAADALLDLVTRGEGR